MIDTGLLTFYLMGLQSDIYEVVNMVWWRRCFGLTVFVLKVLIIFDWVLECFPVSCGGLCSFFILE